MPDRISQCKLSQRGVILYVGWQFAAASNGREQASPHSQTAMFHQLNADHHVAAKSGCRNAPDANVYHV